MGLLGRTISRMRRNLPLSSTTDPSDLKWNLQMARRTLSARKLTS